MTIREFLTSRRIPFEYRLHAPAWCSSRRAQCLRVPGRFVAKAILLAGDNGYLLAVLPATHRIDLERLASAAQLTNVRFATPDEVGAIFADCEPGAVPPFGRLYGIPTIVDSHLAGGSEILVMGNFRHEGLRLRYRDFEAVEAPRRARFAVPESPRERRPAPHRKAG